MKPGSPVPEGYPGTLPTEHRRFLDRALERLAVNPAIAGVVGAGSLGSDTMDAHSDVDLVLGLEPDAVDEVTRDREAVAESLGSLLVAFTGEHVGEPRLLICLFGPPILHVDLKFVPIDEIGERTGPVRLLFDRDGRARSRVRDTEPAPLTVDRQWIEDRFWVWVHYVATKVVRGEIMEAVGGLGMLRQLALGPLLLAASHASPMGVRHIERAAPARMPALYRTVAEPEPGSCMTALDAAVSLYRELRDVGQRRTAAETAAMEYLAGI